LEKHLIINILQKIQLSGYEQKADKSGRFSAKFGFDELVGKSTFYPTFAPEFHPPTFQTCSKYTVHSWSCFCFPMARHWPKPPFLPTVKTVICVTASPPFVFARR